MPKTEWKRKKTKTKDSGASIRGPEHHQPVPSQYKGRGPTVEGIQRVWFNGGGKGVYIWFLAGNIPTGMVSYQKEVVDG